MFVPSSAQLLDGNSTGTYNPNPSIGIPSAIYLTSEQLSQKQLKGKTKMNEQNPVAVEVKPATIILGDDESFKYEQREFESGPTKGVKYAVPQAKTLAGAIERFGEEFVLTNLNQNLVTRIGQKIKNSLVKGETTIEQEASVKALVSANQDGFIYSLADAKAFRPGDRGPSVTAILNSAIAGVKSGTMSVEDAFKALVLAGQKKRGTRTLKAKVVPATVETPSTNPAPEVDSTAKATLKALKRSRSNG